jgi:integrase
LPRLRVCHLDSGVSEVTAAKAYRLLRAIFNTALDDGLIRRNPCRIKGADRENSPERPVLTVAQVYALADAVGLRYRALILLAAFTSLRWAELAALNPADVDLDARTVRVTRQLYYHEAGYSFAPPKSRAGVRVVAFPDLIVSDVASTWNGFPHQHRWSLPARPALRCGTRISGVAFGFPPWLLSASKAFTFTTCGTPETSSLPMRAQT